MESRSLKSGLQANSVFDDRNDNRNDNRNDRREYPTSSVSTRVIAIRDAPKGLDLIRSVLDAL